MNRGVTFVFISLLLLGLVSAQTNATPSTRDPSTPLTNIWNDISNFFNEDISSVNLPDRIKETVQFIFKTQEELTVIRLIFLIVILSSLTYIIFLSIKLLNLRVMKGPLGVLTSFITAILLSFVGALGFFAEKWFNFFETMLSAVSFLAMGSVPLAIIIFLVIIFLVKRGLSVLNKKFKEEKNIEAGEEAGLGLNILRRQGKIVKKRYDK